MRFGLTEETIEKINGIFIKHKEIENVILYGSRAKGNYKNGSDIDISLLGENLNSSIIDKIINDIDDLLLPYTFDISIFNQISNQNLVDHINRVGKTLYKKI